MKKFLVILMLLVMSCEKEETPKPHFNSIPLYSFISGGWKCHTFREEYRNPNGGPWIIHSSSEWSEAKIYDDGICIIIRDSTTMACPYAIIGERILHYWGGAAIELTIERISHDEILFAYDMGNYRTVILATRGQL